jgi:3-deoxy-D-manno-octulosonic-acid transferase
LPLLVLLLQHTPSFHVAPRRSQPALRKAEGSGAAHCISRLECSFFQMYLIYSALLALGLLLGTPYWLYEVLRHGKYRKGLVERFGVVSKRIRKPGQPSIWVHAVSVGEVLAVSQLVSDLRSWSPHRRIVVSTTTDTGQKLAAEHFGAENVFYFPFDFAFSMRRYVAALRPDLVVVAETEFWPNFLRVIRKAGASVAVVNARISDRSLPGYRRWQKILRPVLRNVDLFLAQTAEDARRLVEIGAAADRVFVGGNLKYDVPSPPASPINIQLRSAMSMSGAGPVLVCGSTVDGEEPLLLSAFQNVLVTYPAAVMLLAPRRPERFNGVADLLQQLKIKFCRRTQWESTGEALKGGVLLIDSIGELSSLYALADVAFVGGSLTPRGGHNIIEPAQHGVPILVGPHTENFRDIIELFRSRDAVRVVEPDDLNSTLVELLANEAERKSLGRRAAQTLESQRGATPFTLNKLGALLAHRKQEASPA